MTEATPHPLKTQGFHHFLILLFYDHPPKGGAFVRFPSLHKLHAQKYKTSLSHRFRQCSGKPGRWVIFHIPFCAVSARGATAEPPGRAASTTYFNSRPCERGDSKIKQNMLCFFCNYREKLLTFGQHQLS